MAITSLTYVKVKGYKHLWYVPLKENPITHMHISYRGDKNGYGGRYIKFYLLDGTVDVVKGPYCLVHDGPEMFIEDVGKTPEQVVDMYIDPILLDDDH